MGAGRRDNTGERGNASHPIEHQSAKHRLISQNDCVLSHRLLLVHDFHTDCDTEPFLRCPQVLFCWNLANLKNVGCTIQVHGLAFK